MQVVNLTSPEQAGRFVRGLTATLSRRGGRHQRRNAAKKDQKKEKSGNQKPGSCSPRPDNGAGAGSAMQA